MLIFRLLAGFSSDFFQHYSSFFDVCFSLIIFCTIIPIDNTKIISDNICEKFLNKKIAGCINCYTDAYFELLTLDKKMAIEKQKCVFRLRAGALIKDVNGDRSKMMSNHNITNELALYHLRTNPHCRRFFDEPDDLDAAILSFEKADEKDDEQIVRRGRKPRKI